MVIMHNESDPNTFSLFACDPVALARAQAPRFVHSDAEPVALARGQAPLMTFDAYLCLRVLYSNRYSTLPLGTKQENAQELADTRKNVPGAPELYRINAA